VCRVSRGRGPIDILIFIIDGKKVSIEAGSALIQACEKVLDPTISTKVQV